MRDTDNSNGHTCTGISTADHHIFTHASEVALDQRQVMNVYKNLLLMNNYKSQSSARVDMKSVHQVSVASLMQLCTELKLFPLVC